MRDLPQEVLDALAARVLEERKFIWLTVRDRTTGDPIEYGWWNDVVPVTADFIDGFTGATESRLFRAAGGLVDVGPVQHSSDLSVRTLRISLSHIDAAVANAVRGYDARLAPLTYGRGIFNPHTKALVAPVQPWFVGHIDEMDIPRLREGEFGAIAVTVVSVTRELTRTSGDVRSHESQLARSGGTDHFYKDVASVGEWELFWGQKQGKLGGGGSRGGGGGSF